MKGEIRLKTVLFVCTGNTCRSPIAEGFFNLQAEHAGLPYRAVSAGISAESGNPASESAVKAAIRHGADISKHRAAQITAILVRDASVIICMTARQLQTVTALFPEARDKIYTLSDKDISDPFGGDFETYRLTADEIFFAVSNIADILSKEGGRGGN